VTAFDPWGGILKTKLHNFMNDNDLIPNAIDIKSADKKLDDDF